MKRYTKIRIEENKVLDRIAGLFGRGPQYTVGPEGVSGLKRNADGTAFRIGVYVNPNDWSDNVESNLFELVDGLAVSPNQIKGEGPYADLARDHLEAKRWVDEQGRRAA